MSAGYEVSLSLNSGVPVVDVYGEWVPALTEALTEIINRLANAGHFEIVVNVRRASLEGIAAISSLSRMAQLVRSHYGHIDIVGTIDQINELKHHPIALFRLTSTEEGAIGHIKRIPVLTSGPRITARTQ